MKWLTRFVLWIYYPKTAVINRQNLKFDEPTIIACSHPNTMMDPLHVASRTKKMVHFLANANLFATPFGNWFYSTFFCIPIKRQIDDRKSVDNNSSFDRVIQFLAGGGCLWIAPEGGSYWGRHWMSLKTGTARMALLTEAAHNFERGLRILPVGLNYEAPNYFRTKIVINVGEPIDVRQYQTVHEQGFRHAVNVLTNDLEVALQALEISPSDEEEDSLLKKIEIVMQNEFPASKKEEFFRTQSILKKIQAEQPKDLLKQIDDYFELLKKYKLEDRSVMHFAKLSPWLKWLDWLWIIGGFPIFLYGLINNAIPSFIPYYFTNSRQPYIGYRATVKMVIGLFTFPIFYAIQTVLVHAYFQQNWITWLYLLSLIPSGLFAWHYFGWSKMVTKRWKINRFSSEVQAALLQRRQSIIDNGLALLNEP